MLRYLNSCSRGRGAWLLLAFTAFALEMAALYFQHVMMLKPCVMCIYERCALFGVMVLALVGAIAPKTPLRWVAILVWLYSAWEGVRLSWEHTMIQLHPNPFVTCDFAARFPGWLPLDKWLPSVFVATGDCTEKLCDVSDAGHATVVSCGLCRVPDCGCAGIDSATLQAEAPGFVLALSVKQPHQDQARLSRAFCG